MPQLTPLKFNYEALPSSTSGQASQCGVKIFSKTELQRALYEILRPDKKRQGSEWYLRCFYLDLSWWGSRWLSKTNYSLAKGNEFL